MDKDFTIIGLCGRQFSGKSMLANYLVENKGYKRIYVAQALKQLCSELFHLSIEDMDRLKKEEKEFVLSADNLKYISEITGIPHEITITTFSEINNTLTSIRHAYQFIGTEFIRKYNPNWHIDMILKNLNPAEKYVVDDVRFRNETDAIIKLGGKLAYIVRPQLSNVSHHTSEESLTWRMFNSSHVIINNLDAEHAIKQLMDIIDNNNNLYGESIIDNYHDDFFEVYRKSNYKIVIDKKECPAQVSIHDRTIGWIFRNIDGAKNPLFIEDFKFYI